MFTNAEENHNMERLAVYASSVDVQIHTTYILRLIFATAYDQIVTN